MLETLLPVLDEAGGGVCGSTGDVILSCGELASWLRLISPGCGDAGGVEASFSGAIVYSCCAEFVCRSNGDEYSWSVGEECGAKLEVILRIIVSNGWKPGH